MRMILLWNGLHAHQFVTDIYYPDAAYPLQRRYLYPGNANVLVGTDCVFDFISGPIAHCFSSLFRRLPFTIIDSCVKQHS